MERHRLVRLVAARRLSIGFHIKQTEPRDVALSLVYVFRPLSCFACFYGAFKAFALLFLSVKAKINLLLEPPK